MGLPITRSSNLARFDDRVIGNPKHFSQNPKKIIHVDIDPSSISKRVKVDMPIVGNVFEVICELTEQLKTLKSEGTKIDSLELSKWWKRIEEWRKIDCLSYKNSQEVIKFNDLLRIFIT